MSNSSPEEFKGSIGRTVAESEPWWPEPPHPPKAAPNVVVIVLDDTGFAHLGCYGSTHRDAEHRPPRRGRPALHQLPHDRAVLADARLPAHRAQPPRRRHARRLQLQHRVPEHARPDHAARRHGRRGAARDGYATFAIGKWHLAPMERLLGRRPVRPVAAAEGLRPLLRLPRGRDRPVPPGAHARQPPHRPARAGPRTATTSARTSSTSSIDWVRDLKSVRPDRPFFLYLAFGATHAPHQAPALPRQVPWPLRRGLGRCPRALVRAPGRAGHRPRGHQLAPRNPGVRPWDDLSETERMFAARLQEAFAAFLDHTDAQIGRLVEFLAAAGRARQHAPRAPLRQRRQPGGRPVRRPGRVQLLQRHAARPRRHRRQPARRHRRPAQPQQLPVGLGAGRQHAAPLVQAEHPRRRRARPADRALAGAASPTAAPSAASSATSSTSLPPSSRSPASSRPSAFHGAGADAGARRQHRRRPATTPACAAAAPCQYFEMVRPSRHLERRLEGRHLPPSGRRLRRRRVGAVPPRRGLLRVPRPRRRAAREAATSWSTPWWEEAGANGVLPARRPHDRAVRRSRPAPAPPTRAPSTSTIPPISHIPADAAPAARRPRLDHRLRRHRRRTGGAEGVLYARGSHNVGHTFFIKDGKLQFDYNALGRHYRASGDAKLPSGAPRHRGAVDTRRPQGKALDPGGRSRSRAVPRSSSSCGCSARQASTSGATA